MIQVLPGGGITNLFPHASFLVGKPLRIENSKEFLFIYTISIVTIFEVKIKFLNLINLLDVHE